MIDDSAPRRGPAAKMPFSGRLRNKPPAAPVIPMDARPDRGRMNWFGEGAIERAIRLAGR
jgi:hypothetical protein